ncbi:MAG TPA: hypothetical protein VFV56_12435 [Gaiellaceae bacterium]|nr:hypothetical protein [Gaiellaceae bacterium]
MHGVDERVAHRHDGLVEEVVSEAQGVRAGGDRPDRSLLYPDGVADRLHLERVRHDHPLEAELAAKEIPQDGGAHRPRVVAE